MAPSPDGDPGPVAADAFERTTELAFGVAGLALAALRRVLERSKPANQAGARPPPPSRLLPMAAIGVGLEAQRRSVHAAAALSARLGPLVSSAVHPLVAHGPLAAAGRRLDLRQWSEHGRAAQRRNELAAAAFIRAALGALVAAVLDEVDLNAVAARVDLDRIVERLDLDAIVVRMDVDAVARRVDLAAVTERVMDEVDIGQVVRESSSTMASETIDALRVQGMQADQVLSRIVDRLLRRNGQRNTSPGLHPAATTTGEVDR